MSLTKRNEFIRKTCESIVEEAENGAACFSMASSIFCLVIGSLVAGEQVPEAAINDELGKLIISCIKKASEDLKKEFKEKEKQK